MAISVIEPLRHRCVGCGASCHGRTVQLEPGEEEIRIRGAALALGVLDPIEGRALRQEEGRCVFLTDNRRCSIETRFGPDAKPASCRQFPLVATRVGGEVRVGMDPVCSHDIVGSLQGDRVTAGSVQVRPAPGGPGWEDQELWLSEVLCTPGQTVTGALQEALRVDPDALQGIWRRMVRSLHRSGVAADPRLPTPVMQALAPLWGWQGEGPGRPWLPFAESYALQAADRLVQLRLIGSVRTPSALVILSLMGAWGAWQVTDDVEGFGRTYAAWIRALRDEGFTHRWLPTGEDVAWLLGGASGPRVPSAVD